MSYQLALGLEIHLKVNSATKLFCSCVNNQDESISPNTNICPVCTGQPGALPILQYAAFENSLEMGKALKCTINTTSQFDRKSYFYPDLPMGYQITQFFQPTMTGGQLKFFDEAFDTEQNIRITQIQMETDTAKSIHTDHSSLIDYNRAGTPLVEIVTEPDFVSAEQAGAFLKELQRIARYNNISDANMELGQMRVDVNVSVRQNGKLGTRNEIKNMNSISAIMTVIDQEYERQLAIIQDGGTIEQATRRWDSVSGTTQIMRSKEDALDYRYFPEPDLPPLTLTKDLLKAINAKNLFLPFSFIKRCREEFGFNKEYINTLINHKDTLDYFLACVEKDSCDPKETAKRISGPISAYLNENFLSITELKFDRQEFVAFLRLIEDKKLISNQYKLIMDELIATDNSLETIIQDLGFDQAQSNDDEIITTIQQIIADNPSVVAQYQGGKESAIGFFVGQVMKALKGKVDPNKAKGLLEVELKK